MACWNARRDNLVFRLLLTAIFVRHRARAGPAEIRILGSPGGNVAEYLRLFEVLRVSSPPSIRAAAEAARRAFTQP
jgi:hypothetical protein